jgi:hypothetical protein
MRYFADAAEVYRSPGGVFKVADDHPAAGPRLRGSGLMVRTVCSAPEATATVVLKEPGIPVLEGGSDVRMPMPADAGDRFWRGEYNAAAGLAKGEVKTRGPVSNALKLPLAKPLFPLYEELVAARDAR